jgi:hypothetical protein
MVEKPMEAEKELIEEILQLEECTSMFGVSTKDVRKLAYDFLKSNSYLTIHFNKKTQVAGKKWYYLFVKRHPELNLRQPQNVSVARSKGLNKENISQFFDVLENLVDENQIDALRIYNLDESRFNTVQKKSSSHNSSTKPSSRSDIKW